MEYNFFTRSRKEVFLSITTKNIQNITTINGKKGVENVCFRAGNMTEAANKLKEFINGRKFGSSSLKNVEIFTDPRLCKACLEHEEGTGIFEEAKHISECLCFIEKRKDCPVHKFED